MKKNLIREILELLMEKYPSFYNSGKLAKELGYKLGGDFNKSIQYLSDSKRIQIMWDFDTRSRSIISPNEELYITADGIDFYTNMELITSNYKASQAMRWATWVIAGATVANLIASSLLLILK